MEEQQKLYNGETVQEGDSVKFINSDGIACIGKIQRDNKSNSLFFWNNQFNITDYKSAVKI